MAKGFVIRTVPGWKGNLDVFVERTVDQVGDEVRDDAKRIVPVRTALLQRAIVSNGEGRGVKRKVQIGIDDAVVGPKGEHPGTYGIHVEDGTSISPAQPYLKPALYQRRQL